MIRFYRALLHLYPAGFRREYDSELSAVFEQRMRDRTGPFASILLALEAIADVVPNAIAAHSDILRQDLRYTVRALLRAPGFAFAAILVVALGVGANTAAFSLADFVLLRPLPFPESDRLVSLWQSTPGYPQMELSPPNYRDWKSSAKSFTGMAAYSGWAGNLVGSGEPRRLITTAVTPELMPLMGVPALMGRVIGGGDTLGVAVLSYSLWQGQFGADPGVLGRWILLDGEPYSVIGVMPPTFHFPGRDIALWMPLSFLNDDDRANNMLNVVARLAPGATLESARVELSGIAARLAQEYPKENRDSGATIYGMRTQLSDRARGLVLALCGAALCILLLACANLASLLLARGLTRTRELAVRNALGAGRERLVRQLMTESVGLAVLGGLLGIAMAAAGVPLLGRLVPSTLPISDVPTVDLRVLVFAGALIAITGIGFGIAPALGAGKGGALAALRDGGRTGGGRTQRTRSVLVIIEVAGSVVLLVSAGLLVRTIWQIQAIDPGFRAEGVIAAHTPLPTTKYLTVAARQLFYTRVLQDVRALPGVQNAAYITGLPMVFRGGIWPVSLTGEDVVREATNTASLRYVTSGLFATLDIPLRRGRDIAETDDANHPFVAVVSESFAQRHWPGEDPIGKRFWFAFDQRSVIGVAGDVRVRGLERVSEPQVYLPFKQVKDGWVLGYSPKELVVRSNAPFAQMLPSIRRILTEADPDQPIDNVRALSAIVDEETAPRRVQVRLLAILATIALLIAGVGVHGLLSFSVSQRSQEISIRRALGAQAGPMVRMVLREGLALALLGTVVGVAIAYAAGRAMGSLLYGIQPNDPVTILTAVALGLTTAVLGCLRPALRAARVDPISALRQG
ncbi:MAG: ABC transporter permease [Gemmatimonadota bacterium]